MFSDTLTPFSLAIIRLVSRKLTNLERYIKFGPRHGNIKKNTEKKNVSKYKQLEWSKANKDEDQRNAPLIKALQTSVF